MFLQNSSLLSCWALGRVGGLSPDPSQLSSPQTIMEVAAPQAVSSPGCLTLQCPQKHHEAGALVSPRGSELGISHPKASARLRTDFPASLPAQCLPSARAPSLPWHGDLSPGEMSSMESGKGADLGGREVTNYVSKNPLTTQPSWLFSGKGLRTC